MTAKRKTRPPGGNGRRARTGTETQEQSMQSSAYSLPQNAHSVNAPQMLQVDATTGDAQLAPLYVNRGDAWPNVHPDWRNILATIPQKTLPAATVETRTKPKFVYSWPVLDLGGVLYCRLPRIKGSKNRGLFAMLAGGRTVSLHVMAHAEWDKTRSKLLACGAHQRRDIMAKFNRVELENWLWATQALEHDGQFIEAQNRTARGVGNE